MTDIEFTERLKKHPGLRVNFERMLSLVENTEDEIVRADDAERRVTEELRKTGHNLLQDWASRQSAKVAKRVSEQASDLRKHTKKNSCGTPPTVKLQ